MIELDGISFDPQHTGVYEKLEEVGGRDGRVIVIKGVLPDSPDADALEARLDAIAAAASEDTILRLRAGRRMHVRRRAIRRELLRDALTGAFTLELEAAAPWEEAEEEASGFRFFAASGASLALDVAGNIPTPPVIILEAAGPLVQPSFSDGERTLRYDGTLAAGETLLIDAGHRRAAIGEADVTPYLEGAFPALAPPQATITYEDAPDSSHAGNFLVRHRARWT